MRATDVSSFCRSAIDRTVRRDVQEWVPRERPPIYVAMGRSAHRRRGSRVAQALPDAETRGLLQHGVAERDIGKREAAVPEENRLVVALAADLGAGDDLADLGVQRRLRELALLDMR